MTYLEDDFAAKDYDSGVKKVYARAVEILEDHYNVSYFTGTTNNANANTNYNYANNNTSGGILYGFQRFFSRVWRFFFVVLFVILIIALSVLRPRRRYYRRGWGAPPPPPPMGGFWRRTRPPRGPGFGGPRPGGFSGSRPSGRSPSRWRTLRRLWQRPFGAAVHRAQAEVPRMAEVQAEEDEYLGFV